MGGGKTYRGEGGQKLFFVGGLLVRFCPPPPPLLFLPPPLAFSGTNCKCLFQTTGPQQSMLARPQCCHTTWISTVELGLNQNLGLNWWLSNRHLAGMHLKQSQPVVFVRKPLQTIAITRTKVTPFQLQIELQPLAEKFAMLRSQGFSFQSFFGFCKNIR